MFPHVKQICFRQIEITPDVNRLTEKGYRRIWSVIKRSGLACMPDYYRMLGKHHQCCRDHRIVTNKVALLQCFGCLRKIELNVLGSARRKERKDNEGRCEQSEHKFNHESGTNIRSCFFFWRSRVLVVSREIIRFEIIDRCYAHLTLNADITCEFQKD